MWLSISAASRLLADEMAWKSPVKCRLIHRDDLRVAAAGRAALHAEAGAERRLAQCGRRLLADLAQRVGKADRRRGLAFAGRGRADRGDQDQLALLAGLGRFRDEARVDLGDRLAVGQQRVLGDVDAGGDLGHRLRRLGAGDLDVGRHGHPPGGVFVILIVALATLAMRRARRRTRESGTSASAYCRIIVRP
jgi:hypothetical protein